MILSRRQPLTDESHLELIRRLSRGEPLETPPPPPSEVLTRPTIEAPPIETPLIAPAIQGDINAPVPLRRFPGGGTLVGNLLAPENVDPSFEPLTRNVQPAVPSLDTIGAPPVMMLSRNGHAVSATGGASPLESLQTLARTQEAEQPKRESKKIIALRTGLGLLMGGIPGAVGTLAGDLTDRRALDRGRINENLMRTRGQIARELSVQGSQNDLANDAMTRAYKRAEIGKLSRASEPPGFTLAPGQTRFGSDGRPLANLPPLERPKSTRPPVKQADEQGNEYLADAETGEPLRDAKGEIRYAARAKPLKPDETPKDAATRQRNFIAAQSKYRGLIEEEKAAAQQKDAAFAAYSQAKARYGENADIQPDVIAAKQAADAAQAHYASFWGKKDAAKAEMLQHGDGVGSDGEPIPPKITRGANPTTAPFKPARDGKFHYTTSQIRDAAEKSGKSYDEVLRQLSARPNVAIDQ